MLANFRVKAVDAPVQRETPFLTELSHASTLIRSREARKEFDIDGAGLTVAVLGTGLRRTHRDFNGRVVRPRNFTAGDHADPNDVADIHGHGTSVAGIICAGAIHGGLAPAAKIMPIKVLDDDGHGTFEQVAAGLQWVIDHCRDDDVGAVCLAFADGENHRTDAEFAGDEIFGRIRLLSQMGVACCASAGEDYFTHASAEGMGYPAICRDAISVGAVFEADIGAFAHPSGAEAYETRADRPTPFSQRLHRKVERGCATDVLAPGGLATTSGMLDDSGTSILSGAPRASAIATGVVLLLQALHKRATGSLPMITDLRRWLARGAVSVRDLDEEHDNVRHTGLTFRRIDAFGALEACAVDLAVRAYAEGQASPPRARAGRRAVATALPGLPAAPK